MRVKEVVDKLLRKAQQKHPVGIGEHVHELQDFWDELAKAKISSAHYSEKVEDHLYTGGETVFLEVYQNGDYVYYRVLDNLDLLSREGGM